MAGIRHDMFLHAIIRLGFGLVLLQVYGQIMLPIFRYQNIFRHEKVLCSCSVFQEGALLYSERKELLNQHVKDVHAFHKYYSFILFKRDIIAAMQTFVK